MYIYISIHTYIYMYTYISGQPGYHLRICVYIYVYISIPEYISMYTYMHVRGGVCSDRRLVDRSRKKRTHRSGTHRCIYISIYIHPYLYLAIYLLSIYLSISIYLYLSMYLCISTNIHTCTRRRASVSTARQRESPRTRSSIR